MTTAPVALSERRPTMRLAITAFGALLRRDIRVLRKSVGLFLARVVSQPLLLVFVFAYVFPKIGQGVGGTSEAAAAFSTLLAPGILGLSIINQGIQGVALPLVQEFGYTREIEDRVMAPLPVWGVALAKIVNGALQSVVAAFVVLPLVLFIPATPVTLSINWLEVITILPLACLLAGSLGLAIGTAFNPRHATVIYAVTVLPMTFLGACYYRWDALESIEWLKYAVLVNPLVYMSEGLRMAMTDIPHMSIWGIYAGLIGFTSLFAWIGITSFRKRVLS